MTGPLRAAAVLLAAGLASGVLPGLPSAPAAAAEGVDCRATDAGTDTEAVVGPNDVYDGLGVAESHALLADQGRLPGEGVTVAVVGTGVADGLPVAQRVTLAGATPEVDAPDASIAAGFVTGPPQPPAAGAEEVPVGLAPAASLLDVQVHDQPRGADGELTEPSTDAVVAGLRWVLAADGLPERTVVLVPAAVGRTAALDAAVADALDAGLLVVAPGGDRPAAAEDDPALAAYVHPDGVPPGEDAARDVWPAGYDGVLAAGVDGQGSDVSAAVLQSSAIDLAAPTLGGVSYGANGSPCVVAAHSSVAASAVVAATAALVWSAHPDDSAGELRSRLLRTADGNGVTTSPVTGHGTVQPVEAVRRRLTPRDDGRPAVPPDAAGEAEPAAAPRDPEDVLAGTRRDAVWWGLLGGGALVVAVVLRPVLSRRRRPDPGA